MSDTTLVKQPVFIKFHSGVKMFFWLKTSIISIADALTDKNLIGKKKYHQTYSHTCVENEGGFGFIMVG